MVSTFGAFILDRHDRIDVELSERQEPMPTYRGLPRLLKGALVGVDPDNPPSSQHHSLPNVLLSDTLLPVDIHNGVRTNFRCKREGDKLWTK